MILSILLSNVERGEISAAKAEEMILSEINRIKNKDVYGELIDPDGFYRLAWMGGLDTLKAAIGLTTEKEIL